MEPFPEEPRACGQQDDCDPFCEGLRLSLSPFWETSFKLKMILWYHRNSPKCFSRFMRSKILVLYLWISMICIMSIYLTMIFYTYICIFGMPCMSMSVTFPCISTLDIPCLLSTPCQEMTHMPQQHLWHGPILWMDGTIHSIASQLSIIINWIIVDNYW